MKIQKAAYILFFLAVAAVAFFGMSPIASADHDGYWVGGYGYDDGYDYDNDYYGGYDGGYEDDCYYYNDCYDDYYGGGYDDCYYYDDCYDYDYDDCYYYDCYDYDYDDCYYYDCYDYDYPDYECRNCGSGSTNRIVNETIVDVYNENTNTNTLINYNNDNDRDRDDDDEDEDDDVDFDVICIPSDDEVEEGDRVTFRARVEGVSASRVDFEWSGDVDGDDQEVTERFTREGTYRATVEAEYRGETERDTCTVEVEDENRNNRVSLISTPPTGTPASGVYLSQVPYTGAADNFKLIGFITMLALSSLAGAYYVVTRKARADRKSFIERFKQDNLASRV